MVIRLGNTLVPGYDDSSDADTENSIPMTHKGASTEAPALPAPRAREILVLLPKMMGYQSISLRRAAATPVAVLEHLGLQPEFYSVFVVNSIEGVPEYKQHARLALLDTVDLWSFLAPYQAALLLRIEALPLTASEMRAVLADRESWRPFSLSSSCAAAA